MCPWPAQYSAACSTPCLRNDINQFVCRIFSPAVFLIFLCAVVVQFLNKTYFESNIEQISRLCSAQIGWVEQRCCCCCPISLHSNLQINFISDYGFHIVVRCCAVHAEQLTKVYQINSQFSSAFPFSISLLTLMFEKMHTQLHMFFVTIH